MKRESRRQPAGHREGTHPDRIAIRLDDAVLTYEQLEAATRAVAGLLDGCGVRAGDRVGIMLPNVAHFAILYYGILRIGAIVVPMNPLLKEREVADYLSDSGTKVVFAWHRSIDEATAGAKLADTYAFMVEPSSFKHVLASSPVLDQITEREDAEAAVIRYTSATTGHPKRAELPHGDLAPDVEVALADLIQVTVNDVVFGGAAGPWSGRQPLAGDGGEGVDLRLPDAQPQP